MPDSIDPQHAELFQLYADDQLDPTQAEQLNNLLREDSAVRDTFVAFCLQAQLLKELHTGDTDARDNSAPVTAEPAKSIRSRSLSVAAVVMAALLIMIGVRKWWPDPAVDEPTVKTTADHWTIEPTGSAEFERVESSLVRLDRGELFIQHAAGAESTPLRIVTPVGEATADGSSFYIGTHEVPDNGEQDMLKQMTRVLVLSGVVSLMTSDGRLDGGEGDLLTAGSDASPVKVAVNANSEFAFDLYRHLSVQSDDNLFFSPYSISGALTMAVEGARGETAMEIAKVLHLTPFAHRLGNDAQLIPRKTALVHTGYSQINRRLNSAQTNPRYDAVRTRIDKLQSESNDNAEKLNSMLELSSTGFGTQAEEKEATEFSQDAFEQLMKRQQQVSAELDQLTQQISLYEVRVANAIWLEKTFPIKASFVRTFENYHGGGNIFPVDFRNDFPAAREKINNWCSDQTRNRIPEILPLLSPSEARALRIVLTNAIYFKGDWKTMFRQELTEVMDFTCGDAKTVKTKIMHAPGLNDVRYAAFNADGSFFNTPTHAKPEQQEGLYPDTAGFAMIELPYRGDDLSMLVIAPNQYDGLSKIEQSLTAANVGNWVSQLKSRTTDVRLPVFRQETSYSLKKTLMAMGMTQAFDPVGANFGGMSDSISEPLYLDMVRHKAFIEVNETGTEAAAVTAVGVAFGSPGPPPIPEFIPEFRADRPFIYIIRDDETGTILFLGRMTEPSLPTE